MADSKWTTFENFFFDMSNTSYTSILKVAEYEFESGIALFKMADPKWLTTFEQKLFDLSKTPYPLIFKVTEYEFEIGIPKFKMADPKWPTTFEKILWIKRNLVHFGFWGRWIRIWNRNLKIRNGRPKMTDDLLNL